MKKKKRISLLIIVLFIIGHVILLNQNNYSFSIYATEDDKTVAEEYHNEGSSLLVNENEEIFVGGHSDSINFTLRNKTKNTKGPDYDIFLMKLSKNGTPLFTAYFGSSESNEFLIQMQFNKKNNLILFCVTSSNRIQVNKTIGTPSNNFNNILILEIDQYGNLLYSVLIGGSSGDEFKKAVTNNEQNMIIIGNTYSSDFPMINSIDSSFNGEIDGFFIVLNNSYDIIMSSFLGGDQIDLLADIVLINGTDKIIIGGTSDSSTFNGISNEIFESQGMFLEISIIEKKILNLVTFGGSKLDLIKFMDFDNKRSELNIFGITESPDFIPTLKCSSSLQGNTDLYILTYSLTKKEFSNCLLWGGNSHESIESITTFNDITYITGLTRNYSESENMFTINKNIEISETSKSHLFLLEFDLNQKAISQSILLISGVTTSFQTFYKIIMRENLIYITGIVNEDELKVINGFKKNKGEMTDAFLLIYNVEEEKIMFSTYIGDYILHEDSFKNLKFLLLIFAIIGLFLIYFLTNLILYYLYRKNKKLRSGFYIAGCIGLYYFLFYPFSLPTNSSLMIPFLDITIWSIILLIFSLIYGLALLLISLSNLYPKLRKMQNSIIINTILVIQTLTFILPTTTYILVVNTNHIIWFPGIISIFMIKKIIQLEMDRNIPNDELWFMKE